MYTQALLEQPTIACVYINITISYTRIYIYISIHTHMSICNIYIYMYIFGEIFKAQAGRSMYTSWLQALHNGKHDIMLSNRSRCCLVQICHCTPCLVLGFWDRHADSAKAGNCQIGHHGNASKRMV